MTLYDVNAQISEFLEDEENVDPETGEILDPDGLEQLQLKREEILEGLALTVKNCRAEAEAVKTEKLALAKRQSRLEKKADKLSEFLSGQLQGRKFSTAKVECSFRKSTSTEIFDLGLIPAEYLAFEPKPDKAAIKMAIKAGESVPGAEIRENVSMIIK